MVRIKVSSIFVVKFIYIFFWSSGLIHYLHQNTEKAISKVYCNSSSQGQNDSKASQNFYNLRSSNRNPLQSTFNPRSDNNKEDSNEQSKAVIDAVLKTKDNDDEEEKVSCLNEEGKPVEWFLNMKLPEGFEYMAYDSKDTNKRMHYYDNIRSKSALKNTLDQYYGNEDQFLSIIFNDHEPDKEDGASQYYAHAKGVLQCKGNHCYFLHHTWPKFPPPAIRFDNASKDNAQQFFCISLTLAEADPLFEIWVNIRPNFYSKPKDGTFDSEWLQKIAGNIHYSGEKKDVIIVNFFNNQLTAFYKNRKSSISTGSMWKLLSDVFPKTEFLISSWLSGNTQTVEYTAEHPYMTVVEIVLKANGFRPKREWSYGSDHTKIAISTDPKLPVICFGDLNYVNQKRGGAGYCFENSMLYETFRNEYEYRSDQVAAEVVTYNRDAKHYGYKPYY